MPNKNAEFTFLEQVCGLEIKVLQSSHEKFEDAENFQLILKINEDDVETCSLGLIFAIGALSFHDARPRGHSEMHYQDNDSWTLEDFLMHLSYSRGSLYLSADYIRGRMLKTAVEVFEDGRIKIMTMNRGRSATRWISKIQGKKQISWRGASEVKPSQLH
jgi:hypothetical protein